MSFIPDTLTPVTAVEMYAALSAAAPELQRASVLVLLAQSAFETGHWKSMHGFNVGNSKHVDGAASDWTFFPCNEILLIAEAKRFLAAAQRRAPGFESRGPSPLWRIRRGAGGEAVVPSEDAGSGFDVEVRGERRPGGKVEVWFYPSHRGCRFEAFDCLGKGVERYMRGLRTRYAAAWPAVVAGDPDRFVRTLKALRYMSSDDVDGYASSVVQLVRRFDDETWVASALEQLGFESVVAFQRARGGLIADGLAGPKTRAALGIALEEQRPA